MRAGTLEEYIIQHIEASAGNNINFSWHGGEPTILGLDFYRNIVRIQKKYCPEGKTILNGIQTNGVLIDESWCEFLAQESFYTGISIDGPENMHNIYREGTGGKPTFAIVEKAWEMLRRFGVRHEILCVVNSANVRNPLEVYNFFRKNDAAYITFLPLVELMPDGKISIHSVPPEPFGEFLVKIFDEWKASDIGKIKIQIFEEALRTSFGQDHTLCIFKKECGGVPVIEFNGDFYSCDHYVDSEHLVGNIQTATISEMLDSEQQKLFGRKKYSMLPEYCRQCEVLDMCNGECPRNRFAITPDGEAGLNYLCAGYKIFFRHCKPFTDVVSGVWSGKR